MSTAARKDVALCRVGTWAASTGVTPIATSDLTSMVTAYNDQLVDRPVIKIGHDDASVLNAALGDGEPAYGWVTNLSLGTGTAERPDPETLYGDYTGMPSKLAEVSDTAWRRRSVEIAWDVTTGAGKHYPAVLTGVALLGIAKPAVKGLSDVLALYAAQPTTAGVTAVVQGEDVAQLDLAALSAFAAAQDQVEATRTDTQPVPPASSGSTEGEPASKTSTQTPTEGTRMTISKSDVEKALEQAGDEDVTARLQELLKPGTEDGKPAGTEDGKPAAATATVTPIKPEADAAAIDAAAKTAAAAAADSDTVVITKAMFSELQTGAAAGVEAAAKITADRRDSLVATAFSEGRITGDERQTWREKLDADEPLVTSLLSALQPRFAVHEAGHDLGRPVDAALSEGDEAAWAAFRADIPGA